MSDRWFRVYETLVDDPKVQRLPDRLFKALINIWCIASANDGKMPPVDDIAFKLRLKPDQAIKVLGELTEAGFFDHPDNDPDAVIPHNWNGRQFKSDKPDLTAAERQRKHRNKLRGVTRDAPVTVTPVSLSPETDTDTETDTDRKKKHYAPSRKTSGASRDEYPPAFETLWRAYRPIASPNSTKADAHKAWEKLSPEERDACLAGMTRYVAWLSEEKQKRDGTKPKHLATFINKRGWEPFLERATVISSAANENPNIPPEKLAKIMEDIDREFGGARIR